MRKQNRTQFLQKAKEEYDFWTVTHKRNSKPCPKEDDSVRCYICRWYQSNGSTHREDKGMPQMCCSCSYLLTVLELKDVLREFVVEGIVRYRDTFSDLKQVNKWAVLSDEESWNKFLDEVINHKDEEGMDLSATLGEIEVTLSLLKDKVSYFESMLERKKKELV